MKKTHIFLSAMLLMAASTGAYAQWSNTGGAFTSGNVGIGTTSVPINAALRINGNSCYTNPLIWLNAPPYVYSCGPAATNFFQVTTTTSSGTISYLDAINPSGWLGINKQPVAPLDVAGSALISMSLKVGTTLTVNQSAGINTFLTTGTYLKVGTDLTVTHNATIENDLIAQGGLISMAEAGTADTWRSLQGSSHTQGLGIYGNTTSSNGPTIEMYGPSYYYDPTRLGSFHFTSYGNTATYGYMFLNYTASAPWASLMAITNAGQVVIGADLIGRPWSTLVGDYKLFVSGGILTTKLKVATVGGGYWSDYVFNKNYKLMPLNDVEAYVKANKHLPEIPSASEVEKDGIDVAGMDAKLLQKIEELTLYVIQQQKEIETQNKEIELLKKKMD